MDAETTSWGNPRVMPVYGSQNGEDSVTTTIRATDIHVPRLIAAGFRSGLAASLSLICIHRRRIAEKNPTRMPASSVHSGRPSGLWPKIATNNPTQNTNRTALVLAADFIARV